MKSPVKYITLFIILLISTNAKSQPDVTKNNIIEKERTINADISRVWDVLTNPAHIEQWLGTKVESEWKKGNPITFAFSWNGKEFVDTGEIVSFEENSRFAYTYWSSLSGLPDAQENYSRITFDLQSDGNATKLRLTHTDFATKSMYEHSDKNWEESLNTIKQIAENE